VSICYVDTSVLAKRYIHESRSDQVDDFLAEQSALIITTLTTAEVRSLLARRRRGGDFDAELETQLFAALRDDMRQGYIVEENLSSDILGGAVQLIEQLATVPLRTLDAIHLAASQQLAVDQIATADRRMRDAARELDTPCQFFG
jgi:hypothetical protein